MLPKVAAIDLDNTVADTLECWARARAEQGLAPLPPPQSWTMTEYDPEDQEWCQRRWESAAHYRQLLPFPGAAQALWFLSEYYHLVYITSRPKTPEIVEATLRWPIDQGLPHGEMVFSGHASKGRLLRDLFGERMEFLVDDSPSTAEAASSVFGILTYLVRYPYNEHVPTHENLHRVKSLADVAELRRWEESLPFPDAPRTPDDVPF